jgi:hypothetical protein
MQTISQIRATGYDIDGTRVEWVVATYTDPQEAYKHHLLCHDYLARAQAALPKDLPYKERADAMRWLRPSHDPLYALMQAFDVTYNLDAHPLTASAPAVDTQAWRPLDALSPEVNHLAAGAARRFMRDEELEGAPEDPLPRKENAARALWLIGVDPALPATNARAGETSGDAYYRLFSAAVAERRRVLRERCAVQAA